MLYAKKVIEKNVGHMNIGKISLYDSAIKLFFYKFIDSHFGSFSCIVPLLAHVIISSFWVVTFIIPLFFTEKANHRSRIHFEFSTTFGTLDTTFPRHISVMVTHAQTFFHSVGGATFMFGAFASLCGIETVYLAGGLLKQECSITSYVLKHILSQCFDHISASTFVAISIFHGSLEANLIIELENRIGKIMQMLWRKYW